MQERSSLTLGYHRVKSEHVVAREWERRVAKAAKTEECPKHIFVINDTVAILDLFRSILEEEGFQVTTDGFSIELVEMLGRVKASAPDLIILDFVILDEGKGWQFLQLLKMERQTKDIPVIVCTAAAKLVEELQMHLDAMGVVVVLKPFDIDHLLDEIAKVWTMTAEAGTPSAS
jgi:CheY-like chemotaxis protein